MSSTASKTDSKGIAAKTRAYVASLPPTSRTALKKLRDTIRTAAPGAVENFSYGIPGFRLDGKTLVWYAAWKNHTSLYPITAGMKRAYGPELDAYETSKGTVRFPLGAPLPVAFIRRLVKARVAEIRESGKGEVNARWHAKHRMPTGATMAQRIAWHRVHAKHCACRPIPGTVQAAMRARTSTRATEKR